MNTSSNSTKLYLQWAIFGIVSLNLIRIRVFHLKAGSVTAGVEVTTEGVPPLDLELEAN